MRMLRLAVLALLSCLSFPAMAADNTVLLTPCSSGCVTMRSKDVGTGVQSMIQILGDTSGNAIYGTAGTANANVLSVQGIASGTAMNVAVTSAVGLAQGSTTSGQTGSMVMGAVTTAAPSYTTAQTSPVSLTTAGATRTDNSSWGGTALGTPANFGTSPGAVVSGSVNASVMYGTTAAIGDPCRTNAKVYVPISQTANTQLLAGTSAKKTYICHIIVVAADAENISLVSGTGSVCATSTAAVIGSTTAAAGPNLSANGGFSIGTGVGSVAVSAVNADNVCLFQSGSGRVAGVMTYVAQ